MNERLIDFHLGLLGAADRADLEEALLSSPATLREYLALKRAFDAGAAATVGPSPATRARVPAAVLPRRLPRALYPAVLALATGAALALFLGREHPRPPAVPIDAAGSTSLSAEIL
jgi:hypothetical protein